MRKATADGVGNLLPSPKQVNSKKAGKFLRASKRPKAAKPSPPAASPRPSAYIIPSIPLGVEATGVLINLCDRHKVEPVHVLRTVVESLLSDTCGDSTLAPVIANEARYIKKHGRIEYPGWNKTARKKGPPAIKKEPKAAAPVEEGTVDFEDSLAALVFADRRTWPRTFHLPGLAGFNAQSAQDVLEHLCFVFHKFGDDLHDLVLDRAHDQPTKAAELAEAMAIVEQLVCQGGLATDLDDTPRNGESPFLRLAALAKVQALNKRRK